MRQAIDHVVDADLVRFVRKVDGDEPFVRPFPEFTDVAVVVCDDHQALGGIVVFEDALVGRGRAAPPPEILKYRISRSTMNGYLRNFQTLLD